MVSIIVTDRNATPIIGYRGNFVSWISAVIQLAEVLLSKR